MELSSDTLIYFTDLNDPLMFYLEPSSGHFLFAKTLFYVQKPAESITAIVRILAC